MVGRLTHCSPRLHDRNICQWLEQGSSTCSRSDVQHGLQLTNYYKAKINLVRTSSNVQHTNQTISTSSGTAWMSPCSTEKKIPAQPIGSRQRNHWLINQTKNEAQPPRSDSKNGQSSHQRRLARRPLSQHRQLPLKILQASYVGQ